MSGHWNLVTFLILFHYILALITLSPSEYLLIIFTIICYRFFFSKNTGFFFFFPKISTLFFFSLWKIKLNLFVWAGRYAMQALKQMEPQVKQALQSFPKSVSKLIRVHTRTHTSYILLWTFVYSKKKTTRMRVMFSLSDVWKWLLQRRIRTQDDEERSVSHPRSQVLIISYTIYKE